MKKAYINWKLVLVLMLGFCAVGATVIGLRKFNRTQRAEEGLKAGLQAYEEERWKQAATGLGQYLSVHPTDMEVLLKYGHAQARIRPFNRDHYAQAINAYQSVLRNEGDNQEAALALVDLYLEGQIYGEAEAAALRFLEKNTDSRIVERLAMAQVMQRKFGDAAKLLTDIVARQPDEIAAYEMLARIAQERPELLDKTPQEWIDAAVAKNPEKAQAYILRSGFLLRAGQRDLAIESLRQAAGCDLSEVDTRLAIAVAWLRLDDVQQAQEQLDSVQKENPKLPELWQLRAAVATRFKDPVKAGQMARDGLEQLGEKKDVFLPYAVELFLQAGDVEAARGAVELLQKTEINRGLVCYFQGLLDERDGNWPQATAQWREAVVQGYTVEPVYLKLAEGAVRLEDTTSAIEILRRYIAQNRNAVSAPLMLARILMDGRRWTEASEYTAAVLRVSPGNKEARSLQNRCRIELLAAGPQSQGQVDQLLTELIADDDSLANRLLALRVAMSRLDWPHAKQQLDDLKKRYGDTLQVQMAEVEYCLRKDQKEQAAGLLDEAIRHFPDAAEPVILRAALWSDQNNPPQAIALLEEAAPRLKGQDVRKVQLAMADYYRRAEQTAKAVDLFSKMAAQNPQDVLVRRQLIALGRENADLQQLQKWIDEIKQCEGDAGRLWKIEQASLWMARGEFDKMYPQAVALLNENLKVNPDDKQSLMVLAAAHEQAGNLRLAVSLYRDMLTRNPGDIDLGVAAMGAMYRAQEYRQADQLLADLLATGRSDPRLAQLELQGYLRQGRLDTAETLLEKMVAQNTQDSSAKLSLALLRTRNGQLDAARKLIDELLAENPDVITSHAALADWYLRQNQKDKALAACNDYLAQHDTVDAYRLRAQVLLALNEKEKAIEDIQQMLERADKNAGVFLNVSQLYNAAGLGEKATEAARKALAIEPDSFDAQKQTAILLLAVPQFQREGTELLEKALLQQPRDAQLRLRRASLLLAQGVGPAAVEAVDMLNAIVNEYPRLEPAWSYLIEWYLLNNQTGMAMDTVLRGLETLPDSRMISIYKARIESLRSPAVALETLNRLASKFSADEAILEMRAQMTYRLGKTDEAIMLLRDGVASSPSPQAGRMKLLLMEMLYQKGDVDQAKELYQQFQQNPDTASAAMLGWLRLISTTADAEKSVAVFQQWYDAHPAGGGRVALSAIEGMLADNTAEAAHRAEQILTLVQSREPDSSEAAYGMAMLRHITGRKSDAIPLYERTLQLQPDNVVAMNNLAWILSQEKGEHAKALELADKGLALNPNYTDLIDTRGMICFSLHRYEKAAEDFKAASVRYLDSQPAKGVSTFYLAKCLRQLGKNEQAMVELYKARDLDAKTNGLSDLQKAELTEMLGQ